MQKEKNFDPDQKTQDLYSGIVFSLFFEKLSYLDNFFMHPIVLQSEQDLINHVRHLFEDCHDDEREDLPQENKHLHNALVD